MEFYYFTKSMFDTADQICSIMSTAAMAMAAIEDY